MGNWSVVYVVVWVIGSILIQHSNDAGFIAWSVIAAALILKSE